MIINLVGTTKIWWVPAIIDQVARSIVVKNNSFPKYSVDIRSPHVRWNLHWKDSPDIYLILTLDHVCFCLFLFRPRPKENVKMCLLNRGKSSQRILSAFKVRFFGFQYWSRDCCSVRLAQLVLRNCHFYTWGGEWQWGLFTNFWPVWRVSLPGSFKHCSRPRSVDFLGESGCCFDNISSAVILSCLNKCCYSCCCCFCDGTSPINFVLDRVRFCGIALLSATLILPIS